MADLQDWPSLPLPLWFESSKHIEPYGLHPHPAQHHLAYLRRFIIIGIPFGKQHFKLAKLSLAPFGKAVELGI